LSSRTEPKSPVGTVAELFAGVGGFRLGLENAGWDTVFSNQWEPSTKTQHASSCYVANFSSSGHSNEDISKVVGLLVDGDKAAIPQTDLVVGGFPCQDYSVAKSLNSSKGLEGKKGVLWWEIYKLVSVNKPKYVFLENVDRLLKSPATQRGRDFAIMLRTLGDLGYLVEWRVVNAAEEGFPQRRIRVFIIGVRKDLLTTDSVKSVEEFLCEKSVLGQAFPANPKATAVRFPLDRDPERISNDFGKGLSKSPFLNSGYFLDGEVVTLQVSSIGSTSKRTLGDVLIPEEQVPAEYWVDADRLPEWEYLKGAKSIERRHAGSDTTYFYAEGKMAFPDLLENPSRTILTGEGGSTPSRFKHIIKVGNRYRRLTPVELERLNGFPDDWTKFDANGKPLSDARRAFFMGNALVVGLIERVGIVLARMQER
jgi:DNA (cytosine-5)-methyltransferase 1